MDESRIDKLYSDIRKLVDHYTQGPGDALGLSVVEGMVNQAFNDAGVPPPKRIVLRWVEGNCVVGFDNEA